MKTFIYIILGILLLGCSSYQPLIYDDVYYRTEVIYIEVSPKHLYYYPPYKYIYYDNWRPVYTYPVNRVIKYIPPPPPSNQPKEPAIVQPRSQQGTTVPRSRPAPPSNTRRN